MSGPAAETQTQGVAAFVQALIAAAELGERERPMREVALELASGGWLVFPCDAQRKKPLIPTGFPGRSRDVAIVEGWWTSHPTATVGIVPGDGGLIALDADSSQALASIQSAGLLPDGFLSALREGTLDDRHGLVVASGGSSEPFEFDGWRVPPLHVYLEAPASPPKLAGVVCRFDRGYMIAPGSLGQRARYRLIGRGAPLPFHPKTEINVVPVLPGTRAALDTSLRAPDLDRLRQALTFIPNDAKTDRDQYVAMAHAVKGAVGLDRDADGLELFSEWAGRWPDGADPIEDDRVYSTINQRNVRTGWEMIWRLAAKHGFDATLETLQSAQADFPASSAAPSSVPDEPTIFTRMLKAIRDAQDPTGRLLAVAKLRQRFRLTNIEIERAVASLAGTGAQESDTGHLLSELLQRPELLTMPQAAIPYLAWPGLKTLLSAREKTGKSTLALAGAAAASRGVPFLDDLIDPQTVLWVTEEPLGVVVRRARDMGAEPTRFVVLPMGLNPAEQLQRAMGRWTPQVVVIDTLYRYAGVEDENDAAGWLPVFAQLDEITRRDVALLLLVHATKASKRGEYRGSSAIGGHVDLILAMSAPDAGTVRKLSAIGRIPLSDFEVRLTNDRSRFEILGQQDREAQTVHSVRTFLAANGLTSRSRLRRELQIGQVKVDNALQRLVDEGAVITDSGSYRLVSPSEDFESSADQLDAPGSVGAPSKTAHVGAS